MAKTAGILVVGNEILSGKVVDTNSPYLCQELYTLGVDVRRVAVVPDDIEVIAGQSEWQTAMFSLFNRAQAMGHALVFAGSDTPAASGITLPSSSKPRLPPRR